MVTGNHSYEEQTRRLLSEAQSELRTIESEIAQLEERRTKLALEVDAYDTVLQGYLRRTGKQTVAETDWKKLLAKDKTLKDKLITIAKQGGGRISQSQATDILYGNKLVGAKKRATAYAIMQGYLSDMAKRGIMSKVSPGQYQLVDAQQRLDAHRLASLGLKEERTR